MLMLRFMLLPRFVLLPLLLLICYRRQAVPPPSLGTWIVGGKCGETVRFALNGLHAMQVNHCMWITTDAGAAPLDQHQREGPVFLQMAHSCPSKKHFWHPYMPNAAPSFHLYPLYPSTCTPRPHVGIALPIPTSS
jgi:hypothetical protein